MIRGIGPVYAKRLSRRSGMRRLGIAKLTAAGAWTEVGRSWREALPT
jgi:hypothetical protein